MPLSRIPLLVLLVTLSAALFMSGSDIRQPVTASATSCKNCAVGPDLSVKGGFIGGGFYTLGAAQTIQPFGSLGTTSRWAAPSAMWLSLPVFCINATEAQGVGFQAAWSPQLYAGGVDGAGLPSYPTVLSPNSAAGCYQNVSAFPFYMPKDSRSRWASIINGSGTQAAVSEFSAEVVGTSVIPLGVAAGGVVVATGVTTFASCGGLSPTFSLTEADMRLPVVAGTLQNWSVVLSTAQPAGGALTVTVRDNGVDTAVVITMAGGAAAGTYLSTATAAILDGHTCSIKIGNANAANSGGLVWIGGEELPTTPGAAMVFFGKNTPGTALTASQTRYWASFSGAQPLDTAPANVWFGVPSAFTGNMVRCYVSVAPATNSTIITAYNNSTASVSLTGPLTTGFAAPGVFTISGTESYAALAGMALETITGAGTGPTLAGCTLSGVRT